MATIPVTCNSCGEGFDVDSRKGGLSSPCPHCHARVDVPDDSGAWPASPVAVALARGQRDLPAPTKSRPPAPPSVVSLTTVSTTAPAASPAQSVHDMAIGVLSTAPSEAPDPFPPAAAPPSFPIAQVAIPVAQSPATFVAQPVNHPPIACPYCSQPMGFAADLVGRSVACVRCGQTFTIGVPAMPSLVDTADSIAIRRERGPSLVEAFFMLFDFRFERYLTPWIIRTSWLLILALAAFSLLNAGLHAVGSAAPTKPSFPSVSPTEPIFDPSSLPAEPPFGVDLALRLTRAAVWCLATVLAVLYLRVICEVFIVIFNIATSLKAIEKQTRKP
jgi:DNA-directed RNA polymerase subunit RPC12/RpoP